MLTQRKPKPLSSEDRKAAKLQKMITDAAVQCVLDQSLSGAESQRLLSFVVNEMDPAQTTDSYSDTDIKFQAAKFLLVLSHVGRHEPYDNDAELSRSVKATKLLEGYLVDKKKDGTPKVESLAAIRIWEMVAALRTREPDRIAACVEDLANKPTDFKAANENDMIAWTFASFGYAVLGQGEALVHYLQDQQANMDRASWKGPP